MAKRRGQAEAEAAEREFAELLATLSTRVKQLRARRGMSRKLLPVQSGVSERYLAQLEAGRANVTLQVLMRIGEALNMGLTDLLASPESDSPDLHLARRLLEGLSGDQQAEALRVLRERFGGPRRNPSGAVGLIGLRGAGKTTLGRRLAAHFDVPFVRLGALVESTAGIDMAEIFLTMGQQGYRRLEYGALRQVLDRHPRVVVEAGGSIVSEARTFDLLLSSCFTVWLTASPREHMERVVRQGDLRPMEGNRQAMDDLEAILAARTPFYSQASARLDTAGRQEDDCLHDLIRLCEPSLSGDLSARVTT